MTHRILVVEPDSHHRLIVEVMIKRAGFEVLACSSGGEALARMGKFDIDLVIAEIDLDGMTGLELCQNIKSNANWADIPFIFLTRRKNLHERVRAIQLGVENFLVKPVYVRELISRVQMLLREQEVASVTKKQLRDQYEGRLSEALLIDIIRSLENRSATGAIELYRENRSGTIWLEEGRVMDALTGSLLGKEAVYRLLLWRTGKFLIRFFPVSRPARIHKTNEDLIYEGLRRLDEWNSITSTLPGLDGVNLLDILEYAEGNEIPAGVDKLLDFLTPQTTTMDIVPKTGEKPKTSPAEALNILASHTVEMLAPIDSESANIPMDPGEPSVENDEEEHIETFVSTEQPDSTNLNISDNVMPSGNDAGISVPDPVTDEIDHVSSVVDFLNRPLDEVGSLWAQEAQKDFDLADILPSSEEMKHLRDRIGGLSESIQPPDQQSVDHFAAKMDSSLSDEEETIINTLTNREAEKYNQPWEAKLEEILENSSGPDTEKFRTPEELEEWNVLSPKIRREREITGNPIRPEGMSDVFEPSFAHQVEQKSDMSPSEDEAPEDEQQQSSSALYSAPTVLLEAVSATMAGDENAVTAAGTSTETTHTDTCEAAQPEGPGNLPADEPPAETTPPQQVESTPESTDDIQDIADDDVDEVSDRPVPPELPAEETSAQPVHEDNPDTADEPFTAPAGDAIGKEEPDMPDELPEPPAQMPEEPVYREPPVRPVHEEPPPAGPPPEPENPPPVQEEPSTAEEASTSEEYPKPPEPAPEEEPQRIDDPPAAATPPVVAEPVPVPDVAQDAAQHDEELDPLLAPAPPAPDDDSDEEDYFGEPPRRWPAYAAAVAVLAVIIGIIGYSQISGETPDSDTQIQKAHAQANTAGNTDTVALPDFDLNEPEGEALPVAADEQTADTVALADVQQARQNIEAGAPAKEKAPDPVPVAAPEPKKVAENKQPATKPVTRKAAAPTPKTPAATPRVKSKPAKPAAAAPEPEEPAATASVAALIRKGKSLVSSRKFAQAESVFREAASAAPGSAVPYYWLGEIDIKKGDMKAAREQLRTATRKQKNYAPAWKRLGYVNEYLGDIPKAKEAYKTFLKYSPKGKNARTVRNILKEL